MTGLISVPHEPTDACDRVHCYSHNVDEDDTRCFIECFECGHVYRTKRELVWAYRRAFWRTVWNVPPPPPAEAFIGTPFEGVDMSEPPWWRKLWHVAAIRAERIYFCQHCIHDF